MSSTSSATARAFSISTTASTASGSGSSSPIGISGPRSGSQSHLLSWKRASLTRRWTRGGIVDPLPGHEHHHGEGHPSGHESHLDHRAMGHGGNMPAGPAAREPMRHAGSGHGQHIADLRKRFWVSLAASLPVLALSPMVQRFLGLGDSLRFRGDSIVLFAVSSFVYFYGGRPFLGGLLRAL